MNQEFKINSIVTLIKNNFDADVKKLQSEEHFKRGIVIILNQNLFLKILKNNKK